MQYFSSATRLLSLKPLKFISSTPFQAAFFATRDKNKRIVDRNVNNKERFLEEEEDNEPALPVVETKASKLGLRKRYVYSELDQDVTEIEIAPKKGAKEPKEIVDDDKALAVDSAENEVKTTAFENKGGLPTERLSKRLSRLGVCSRRQAERLIQTGIVKVNNKKVDSNVPVTFKDKISLFTQNGERIPMKQNSKLWVFNKPKGLICTHDDPRDRLTIFQYLREKGFSDQHFISVGRLDFMSEGLILITNDGELAQALERPSSQIDRTYRVRVFGRFDEQKLHQIRQGVTIRGVRYGPYWVEIEKRQTRNTWLRIKLQTGKNREIRRLMQKFSLRVNRIQRVQYGPYKLGQLPQGEWVEVEITPRVKRVLYMRMRHVAEEKQAALALGEKEKLQQIAANQADFKALPFNVKTDARRIEAPPKAKMVTKKFADEVKKPKQITAKKV